ncbi:MAG TPA: TMEM175 family protein [Gammaproteobacteria bacterium]|nr:TMEM175 family protein [Gammaproteobacteria bacterium]
MGKGRMEAFSDGVLAVIITVMVLEMKVPHAADLAALAPVLPVFLVYVLSFIYLAIYWNNHHHLVHAVERVSGPAMWANLHLLFWLSLIPFVTGWMGENHYAALPTAVYGVVLLAAALAWQPLQRALIAANGGAQSKLARAVRRDFKGKLSVVFYVVAIGLAFVNQWIADALYVLVAILWLVPDRRIERVLSE